MNESFWLGVAQSLIGTTAGALLGYGSAVWQQRRTRKHEQYLVAVASMDVLREQIQDFLDFKTTYNDALKEAIEPGKPLAPRWFRGRPIVGKFHPSLTFDYPRLTFLIDYRQADTMGLLRTADRNYRRLSELADSYNGNVIRKQQRLADKHPEDKTLSADQLDRAIGPEIIGAIDSYMAGIERHLEDDMAAYEGAESALSAASLKLFLGKRRLNIQISRRANAEC